MWLGLDWVVYVCFAAQVNNYEGDIRVCGIAVLDNFSCGISVILITLPRRHSFGSSRNLSFPTNEPKECLRGRLAVLRYSPNLRDAVILDGIKNYPSSPPTFSEPFPVSDRFISC